MTPTELLDRVARRGGGVRVVGDRLQYRPPGVLTDAELGWLLAHQDDVLRALARDCVAGRPPLGEAGPGVKAWRCRLAIASTHVRSERVDGSAYCATCHPPTLERLH